MGVITEGSISGNLPDAEAFAVNYPGYPSSTSRAIDTLGGIDEILKTRNSPTNKLDLRFRPEDPYCHPTSGMADYQYVLPVHADVARRRKRHSTEGEAHFEKGGLLDLDQDDLMCLVPPFFSHKDKDEPGNLVLKHHNLNSKRRYASVLRNQWEMEIEPCFAIDFNIEEIPKKINWEDNIPQGSASWEWQMVMSKLFDERPIWPRRSVHDHLLVNGLKVTIDQLKRLFLRNAYYFATGPFGHFWIKKGYDPRKDPESRIYQRVDFRLPYQLRTSGEMSTVDELKHTWKDICEFRAFPSKSFMCLQFFELADDYIQEEIRKPAEQTTCTHLTGWFSKNLFESLKLRVSMKFLSICPRVGAKDLFNSVSERFERSKRLQVHGRDSRPDEEEHQLVIRDPNNLSADGLDIRSNDTEIACDDDDDDEAEDEEEEEEEEYGLPYGDGGDSNFSLDPSSYPVGENISNGYLQQLFGSLPFIDGNYSDAQDANISDGEYQIYEQDSGGDSDNYNDNEDDGHQSEG
ncbi:uncharacterized protein LOC131217218 isoform X2 [Magnolia sinica]|uniref:uncharacterized protein LOC131217218 isoform X2 n=1 Tax=Magnolia sinica TaxID=86752 RepID=UPI00265AD29C|nr:uncharacterized protein LOC131217218 isoform X2 [Magnolia sinica]